MEREMKLIIKSSRKLMRKIVKKSKKKENKSFSHQIISNLYAAWQCNEFI